MSNIPLSAYSLKKSDEISSLALARSLRPNSPWFLLTGGLKPMLVHLSGEHAGFAFETSDWRSEDMIAFEDIEFEVVDTSLVQGSIIDLPQTALILSPTKRGITALRNSRGLNDECFVFFDDQEPAAALPSPIVFFREWRIVKQIGEKRQALFAQKLEQ